MNKKINTRFFIIAGLSLAVTTFIIDLQTPLGIADGIGYIMIMLLSVWVNEKKVTVVAAITAIVFIIGGYFFSPSAPPVTEAYIAIANRLLSIVAVIVCALIIIKHKKFEQVIIKQQRELQMLTSNLNIMNSELELRVKDRTIQLEKTLNDLKISSRELQNNLKHEKGLNDLKSRFVSMASHEFRTPLTTILSSLSLVSTYSEQNQKDKQFKHIHKIKSAVLHLTDLINDVLSVSKLEEGKIYIALENFKINDLTRDIVEEMQQITKLNQTVVYKHSGKNELIFDKKILKHIILNLLSNAIKFSNEGAITISTEVNETDFILKVEDKGIGISVEDQKHLFERFFRGDNASTIQGTGLGLNIVAKYVEIIKGNIDFISRLGEGTTFIIKFNLKENILPTTSHTFQDRI